MENKRVNLEKLFDLVRGVAENYEAQNGEEDIVLLKPHELNKFSDELVSAVEEFIKEDVKDVEDLEELDDDFEYDTFLYDDDDDDD